jgi:hypothetical protein
MRPAETTAMKTGRSGSQKRRTTARIAINCTPAQSEIMKKIAATGLSPVGRTLPPRRPPLGAE